MITNLTQGQIDKIQIDAGVVYVNYGETDEKMLGPTRGGSEFTVTPTVRDIEFDGRRGKEKGMQVIEELNATLKVTTLNADQETLKMALIDSTVDNDAIVSGVVGLIPTAKYLKNITMFAKLIDGTFKKITIYNAITEGEFTFSTQPKAEGEYELTFNACWDPLDITKIIYKVEDVETFPVVE